MKKFFIVFACFFLFSANNIFAQATSPGFTAVFEDGKPVTQQLGDQTVSQFTLKYQNAEDLEMLVAKAKRFESGGTLLTMEGEKDGIRDCKLTFKNPGEVRYLHKLFLTFDIRKIIQNGEEFTLDEFVSKNQ